jgi:hypothetical protein
MSSLHLSQLLVQSYYLSGSVFPSSVMAGGLPGGLKRMGYSTVTRGRLQYFAFRPDAPDGLNGRGKKAQLRDFETFLFAKEAVTRMYARLH